MKIVALIGLLALSGCATIPAEGPQYACECHADNDQNMVLMNWWARELVNGDISLNEYKFLVSGRLAIMR